MDPEPVEHSGEIAGNQTWSGTHIMTNDVNVTGSLTVEACSTLEFKSGVVMSISEGGSVRLEGAADCPVRVTSAKGAPAAGDWGRIDIYNTANNNNLLENVVVEYGGSEGSYGSIWAEEGAYIEMRDVTVRNSGAHGVYFEKSPDIEAFVDVDISNVELEAVRINSNDVGALESLSTDGARVMVTGDQISSESTWTALEAPYLIDQDLSVRANWEVQAGAVVHVGSADVISVEDGGQLRLMGESGNRVTFRGALWVESAQTVTLDNVSFSMVDSCDVSGDGTIDAMMTDFQRCD